LPEVGGFVEAIKKSVGCLKEKVRSYESGLRKDYEGRFGHLTSRRHWYVAEEMKRNLERYRKSALLKCFVENVVAVEYALGRMDSWFSGFAGLRSVVEADAHEMGVGD